MASRPGRRCLGVPLFYCDSIHSPTVFRNKREGTRLPKLLKLTTPVDGLAYIVQTDDGQYDATYDGLLRHTGYYEKDNTRSVELNPVEDIVPVLQGDRWMFFHTSGAHRTFVVGDIEWDLTDDDDGKPQTPQTLGLLDSYTVIINDELEGYTPDEVDYEAIGEVSNMTGWLIWGATVRETKQIPEKQIPKK